MTYFLFLLNPGIFRMIWIPLFIAECVAQFVLHRQDVVAVIAGVLVSVITVRWALGSVYEVCPADCAKCAEDGETA
ncbi:hypothetical protein ACIQH0_37715 [Streptomyces griseus]|uniref:hypothetical protein n=1 Tax=Streptomyces griseus TaxID=1911 RepID=UPI00380F8238